MASISSRTDFIGDVNLAQLTGIDADLTNLITQVEKKYLRLLFGDDLYILFIAGLVAETTKYETLRDGENYKIGDLTYVYEGLKKMLLYFIFAEYKIITLSEDTSIGTVRQTKDKSNNLHRYEVEKVSNDAFNKGVDLFHDAYDYIYYNSSDFATWEYFDIKKRSHFDKLSYS